MSVKAMGLVWDLDNEQIDREEKYVLLAYADHADANGKSIFPAVDTIAKKTGYKERAIQMITKSLSEKGYLVEDGKGPKGTNKWLIPFDAEGVRIAPAKNAPPQNSASGGAKSTVQGVQQDAPDPLRTIKEPSLTGALSKKDFEQVNAKVDAIIESSKKARYQNRDKMPETYLIYADLYNELTTQEPTKRVLLDWMATFEEWKQEGLQPEHIRAAWQHANRPDGGFMVGRPGALTTTAVGMKSKMIAKPAAPQIDRTALEETQRLIQEKESLFQPAQFERTRPKGI